MSLLLDHDQPAPRTEGQPPDSSALPCVVYVTCVRWYNANVQYGLEFLEACRVRGHEVLVVAPDGYPVLEQAARRQMATHSIPGRGMMAILLGLRFIRALPKDTLLVSGCSRSMNCLRVLDRKKPLLRVRIDNRPLGIGWLSRLSYGRLKGLIMPSVADAKAFSQALGLEDRRLFNHPGTADPSPLATPEQGRLLRSRLCIAPDRLLIGMVARLDHVKGHRTAIEALAKCPSRNVHLLITGEPVNVRLEELNDLALQLGVADRVTVMDRLPDPGPVFAACDAGLIASHGSEPQSRVMIEWAVHGKPVISTRVGMCSTLGGDLGPCVPPADAAALAQAMDHLSTRGLDPSLRQTMQRAASRFSRVQWNKAVASYMRHVAASGFLVDGLDLLGAFSCF